MPNGIQDGRAASTLGWVQYRLGHLTEAEKALNAVASSGNLNADTAYYVANSSIEQSDL